MLAIRKLGDPPVQCPTSVQQQLILSWISETLILTFGLERKYANRKDTLLGMADRLIREALRMRAECQTLKSGNQALRETAAMLTRELEDTYQALEAAEDAEQDIQGRLDVQRRHASVATLACQHAREECKTLKSGNQALRETVALFTRELEDTYEALKTEEEGGDEIQRNLEEQNKVLKQKLEESDGQRANQERELDEQRRILEHTALQLRASEERIGKLEEQLKRAKEIIGKQNDKKHV